MAALLVAGADVDGKDNAGLTPLAWAIMRGQNNTARLLVQHGTDVNSRDNNGVSSLMYADGMLQKMPQMRAMGGAGAAARPRPAQ